MLNHLIEKSIYTIQKGERLATLLSPLGYYVAFSGGKDSQVVLDLVKRSGVKYQAVYSATTNDPPDNVRFIHDHYKDVIIDCPSTSFLRLVSQKGMPTIFMRYCCAILKEQKGVGRVVITGVRRSESVKRSHYDTFVDSKGKTRVLEKMEENNFQCVNGKDKFLLHPILDWSDNDIWSYIKEFNLPINPCYKQFKRVGCMFCPFASKHEILNTISQRPKQFNALLNAIGKFMSTNPENNVFEDELDFFNWWLSKLPIKDYVEKKKQLCIPF